MYAFDIERPATVAEAVAALSNELRHWNGRCGMGAVFGSKNLRAIAVKGNDKDFMKKEEEVAPEAEPTTKECPYCYSSISISATRCPNCTSNLDK